MAFLLRFDGSNDRVTLASSISLTNIGDYIEFDAEVASSGQQLLGLAGAFTDLLEQQNDSVSYALRAGNQRPPNITISSPIAGTRATLRVTKTATNYEFRVNGVLEGVWGGGGGATNALTFNELGATASSFFGQMDLYGFAVSTNGGASVTNNYDPSASNGTGSILPDTTGNNDGTLVNFPNDDSQWVFFDDGQGSIVTADAAYTIAAPTFTANVSVTLPAPIADAAFSIGAPLFNASASATLPQPTADGAFSIASPLFSVSTTATLPQPIADAAFTINAPTFAATASATTPGFNASVSFAIPAPTFSADATVTLPSPTADVSYTIAAPTFSVDADATLPQPSSDVAFAVNSPSFAVTATATEPGFNASVNFTVNAPTFAVDTTATLPQPSADVGFTVSAPTFSVVAIVGGIAIIVDNETNINLPALSNNATVPALSTNVDVPALSNNMRI